MSDLQISVGNALDLYHAPQAMRRTVDNIEKIVDTAAALQRWEDLERAIDFLIECQQVILWWWDDHVRGPGGDRQSIVAPEETMLSATNAAKLIGHDKIQISRWRAAHKDMDTYRANIESAARRSAELATADNHRAKGTGQNEWHTPEQYVEAARAVLGTIDLDPASNEVAQEVIRATTFYTKEEDGLAKPWRGSVWLNPPYSQPLIGQFGERLVAEYTAGNVPRAIMLTHNYTDTGWFHRAEREASLICFTRGRIKFIDDNEAECNPTQGQAFFYYGKEPAVFRDMFAPFGFIR
jgi:phage N-6-adenine-methyltransferase